MLYTAVDFFAAGMQRVIRVFPTTGTRPQRWVVSVDMVFVLDGTRQERREILSEIDLDRALEKARKMGKEEGLPVLVHEWRDSGKIKKIYW